MREREREMEREAEAGTSSDKHKEMSEKRTRLCDFVEQQEIEEDDDFLDQNDDVRGHGDGFVPGPLLSLKDQIEKDKVFIYSLSSYFHISFYLL